MDLAVAEQSASYDEFLRHAERVSRDRRQRALIVSCGWLAVALVVQLLLIDDRLTLLAAALTTVATAMIVWGEICARTSPDRLVSRVAAASDARHGWRPRSGQPVGDTGPQPRVLVTRTFDATGKVGVGLRRWSVHRRTGVWVEHDDWQVKPRFFRSVDAAERHERKLTQRASEINAELQSAWRFAHGAGE